MGRRRDGNGETRRRKEGYFEEEERGGTNRANVLTDALAEKQGLPLRNQASNALGKAHLQRHLNPFQNHHEESTSIRTIIKAFTSNGLPQLQAV